MEEIIQLLKTDAGKAITQLTVNSIPEKTIKALREEFNEVKRDARKTQVGQVQKDKTVGKGEKRRVVEGVRVPIPFQNKIVNTSVAFEIGEPVSLIASEENKLSSEIERLWKNNRIDAILQKAKVLQKSELQSAILFYIQDINSKTAFNKELGPNDKKQIKARILENKNGKMTPYFDEFGDMKFFIWEFKTKDLDEKEVRHAWIYDDTKVYKCKSADGKMELNTEDDHGFGKIPIVYLHQDEPEWFDVQKMIDRLEVSLSKLGASNDYSGHPILLLYGEVKGASDKDEDGKVLRMNMEEDDTTGKVKHGEAKFLTREGAADSVKLELERLEKYIYAMSSTPDISFENTKGLGNVSGVALKLMFLDAILKAKMNEGENRTIIERIINIFIAGTVNTTATTLGKLTQKTFFDVQFNSILPDDLSGSVETLVAAVGGKIMSQKTAIKYLDMTEDVDDELEEINKAYNNGFTGGAKLA